MNDYFAKIGFWPEGTGIGGYAVGFILSLALTVCSYELATLHILPFTASTVALAVLALSQFAVQIIFFFHLAGKGITRDRLVLLGAATLIVCILVGGSLWIMTTLSGRMTPSTQQMELYMQNQAGF